MNKNSPPSASPTQSHGAYRPDIDGLRALAILPVVFYHAFPNAVPGGFVGVDIFFVISGFLITSIIVGQLKLSRFSFPEFYSRRALRLFPALSAVLLTTLLFAWFSLDADEFKMLGKHTAAGAGFVQNLVLWGEVGYFDVSSEIKPLLHLWSLAVEEQFYLAFPLLVWLVWRAGLNLLSIVLLIALSSFTFSMVWLRIDPVAAFYFPHSRVWELMAGALLAISASGSMSLAREQKFGATLGIAQRVSVRCGRWISHFFDKLTSTLAARGLGKSALSWLGFSLILLSTLALSNDHPFPGWRALLPVTGAVLIIYAGQNAWVNQRLLSNKQMIYVGLISYPLYLWHWPLLSFAKIIESEPLSLSLRCALVALSFVLAALTYHLVEKPIRKGKSQHAWTMALILLMVCLGTAGYMAYERKLTSRIGANVEEISAWEEAHTTFEKNCTEYFPKWNERKDSFKCLTLRSGKPDIVVIGDSHARRLHYGVSHFFSQKYNTALFASGCAMPFYDVSVGIRAKYRTKDYSYFRANLINQALDFSITEPAVNLIVLTTSACWSNIVDISDLDETNAEKIVEEKMRLTFDKMSQSGKQIIYVRDNPALDFDPKSCVTRPFQINSNQTRCKMKRAVFDNFRVSYYQILDRVLPEYPNIKVFDAASKLCDEEYCYAVIDNVLMYQDGSHLSYAGSKYIGQFMIPLIEEALNQAR